MNALAGHVIKEASDVGASDAIIDPLYRSETMQDPIINDGSNHLNGHSFTDIWNSVIVLLQRLSPPLGTSLHALCSGGNLNQIADGFATVHFPTQYQFSKRLLERAEKKALIEDAIEKIVGIKLKIRFTVEGQSSPIDPRESIRRELSNAKDLLSLKEARAEREVILPPPLSRGDEVFNDYLQRKCESPIEEHFAKAWANLMEVRYPWTTTLFHFEHYDGLSAFTDRTPLHLAQLDFFCQQYVVDQFRLDFLIARVAQDVVDGRNVLRKLPPVVVECDGHDFHEKTKEQAQRDKSRDRQLTALRYRVVRFTGSELHRDAMRCAKEVDELFRSLLNEPSPIFK